MIDSSKDLEISNIQHLQWLPWIGKEYFQNQKRLLIVGESQYAKGSTPEEFEKDFLLVSKNDFTRNMIEKTQILHEYNHKPLEALKRTLFHDKHINDKVLWKNVGFYNFVQRTLDYRKTTVKPEGERPIISDINIGWEVFAELVKILKPTDCVFIGVEAAVAVERIMDDLKIKRTDRLIGDKINGTYSRTISIEIQKQETQISFLKHSSQGFSPLLWSEFLENNHTQVINDLTQKIT